MSIFKGSGVALVTPFKDGRVDYDALERLIEWQIAEGTDAIISCGTTGEASTLSAVEKLSVIEFTVNKVDGRIPVIAGAGTNDTSHSMYLAKEIQYIGADGLLAVTPYYNKATQRGLLRHYNMIADYTDLPMILYSVKSRTGLNIEPETVKELSKHPNIVGIKEAAEISLKSAQSRLYAEKISTCIREMTTIPYLSCSSVELAVFQRLPILFRQITIECATIF